MAIFKKEIISNQQFLEMCKVGDTQGVIEAVNSGINVDATRHDGNTALRDATYQGHTETVNALIRAGANLDATAIIRAVMVGGPETVNALIEAGANLNANDKYGRTALIEAATWGRTEIVNALIDSGSNVKHKDNSGKTALDYARENYNLRYSDALKRLEELSR